MEHYFLLAARKNAVKRQSYILLLQDKLVVILALDTAHVKEAHRAEKKQTIGAKKLFPSVPRRGGKRVTRPAPKRVNRVSKRGGRAEPQRESGGKYIISDHRPSAH